MDEDEGGAHLLDVFGDPEDLLLHPPEQHDNPDFNYDDDDEIGNESDGYIPPPVRAVEEEDEAMDIVEMAMEQARRRPMNAQQRGEMRVNAMMNRLNGAQAQGHIEPQFYPFIEGMNNHDPIQEPLDGEFLQHGDGPHGNAAPNLQFVDQFVPDRRNSPIEEDHEAHWGHDYGHRPPLFDYEYGDNLVEDEPPGNPMGAHLPYFEDYDEESNEESDFEYVEAQNDRYIGAAPGYHRMEDNPMPAEDNFENQFELEEELFDQLLRELLHADDVPAVPGEGLDGGGLFDIRNSREKICLQDISSFTWLELVLRYKIPEDAERAIRQFYSVISDPDAPTITPNEIRTAKKRLLELTGLQYRIHGRCPKNCVAYADDDDVSQECPVCRTARYKLDRNGVRQHAATYLTLPILPRIIAWFSDRYKAEILSTYSVHAQMSYEQQIFSDFWSGQLFRRLKDEKGFFSRPTDLAFFFSADEYRSFHKHSGFGVWPLVLACYNFPPEIRYREWNTITFGLIPGPGKVEKGRIDTFLYPLIQEFQELGDGLRGVWNAYLGRTFDLFAWMTVVGSDTIARKYLARTMGPRAKSYCDYCEICGIGIGQKGVYCPRHQPLDIPARKVQQEQSFRRRGLPYFDTTAQGDARRANPVFRTDERFRQVARALQEQPNKDLSRLYGIKGETTLAALDSIIFPWSFPPDFMHLILLGLLKHIHHHLTGERMPRGNEPRLFAEDFIWNAIGEDQLASRSTYPAEFGDCFNIDKYWRSMKAANWHTWAIQQALIYLRGIFQTPEEYEVMQKVIFAVDLCRRRELTWEEVDVLEQLFDDFIVYFELDVYNRRYANITFCKPTYHQVTHTGHGIRMCGPMPGFWQFMMERKCGKLGIARSKKMPNESLFNLVHVTEMLKMIPYILPPLTGRASRGGVAGTGLDTPNDDTYCDNDGCLILTRLLAFYKRQLAEEWSLLGQELPNQLPPDASKRRRAKIKREFQQQPLAGLLEKLPLNPHGNGQQIELLEPPADWDIFEDDYAFYVNRNPFLDLDRFTADGRPRPVEQLRTAAPAIRHFYPNEPRDLESKKEVRFYEPIRAGPHTELSDAEANRLMVFLRQHNLIDAELSRQYPHQGSNLQLYNCLENLGLEVTKWKSMDIRYGRDARSSFAGLSGFIQRSRVNGTVQARTDKERSSAFIHYLENPYDREAVEAGTKKGADTKIGEVEFFVSLQNPLWLSQRARYAGRGGNGQREDRQEDNMLMLGFVRMVPIELTGDGLLVRRRRDGPGPVPRAVMHAIGTVSLVGILVCNTARYITWSDGCWTDEGRQRVIDQVRVRLHGRP